MTFAARTALIALGLALGLAGAELQARPLLMEGKQATFQRVLTRPGTQVLAAPDGAVLKTEAAFHPFYVYERQAEWLRVGTSASAGPTGWVRAGSVVEWKQNITAAFTNAAGRSRQVMLEDRATLEALMQDEDVRARLADLVAQSDSGHVDPAQKVVSVEPAEFINIREKLYLMPILSFEEILHPLTYEPDLLLELASIPQRAPSPPAAAPPSPFDAGVVFVIDTTRSMRPYINSTRAAVARIVQSLRATDLGARVQFGVIGFRDNPASDPAGIGYRTRTLAPLARRADQAEVLAALDAAAEVATVSTPGFNEDSMAGVEDAVGTIDWTGGGADPFEGRYVILITDAGPDAQDDPDARSQIGPAELRADAEAHGIAVLTLHLRTPAGGAAQHGYAEAAYRQLSGFGGRDFYYPIENGDEAVFAATVERMVVALTDTIRTAMGQQPALPPEAGGDARIAELGLAMQLAWLGGQPGVAPPDVLRGWMSEKAVEDPRRLAVEPRLLVSKNEMATMAELLTEIGTAGEQNRSAEETDAFFDQIQSVIARMAQNPDRLIDAEAGSLGGALEFLEDLPYRSQLLSIDRTIWAQSAVQRREILDGLHRKIVQYRKWLLDPTVWTPLEPGAPDGEYVFAMPFDVLP